MRMIRIQRVTMLETFYTKIFYPGSQFLKSQLTNAKIFPHDK